MTIQTNFQLLLVDVPADQENGDLLPNRRQRNLRPLMNDDPLDDESSFFSDDVDSISFFGQDNDSDDQSLTYELRDLTVDGRPPRCLEEWIESLDLGLSQHSTCSATMDEHDETDGETSAQRMRQRRFQQALRDMANEDPFELQDSLHNARNRGVPVSKSRSGNDGGNNSNNNNSVTHDDTGDATSSDVVDAE